MAGNSAYAPPGPPAPPGHRSAPPWAPPSSPRGRRTYAGSRSRPRRCGKSPVGESRDGREATITVPPGEQESSGASGFVEGWPYGIIGEAFGADFAANPQQLPTVTVYSAKDLQIDGSGIRETRLRDPDSAYPFRYVGLHLLERSGDKYFFITNNRGQVMILREDDDVRMEFRTAPG
jgi:hypothetical protein